MSGWGRRAFLLLGVAAAIFALTLGWGLVSNAGAPPPDARPLAQTGRAVDVDPVAAWQARLAQRPEDAGAYAQLGLALLQKVRESSDTTLYARAEQAFMQALQREPEQLDALVGKGTLLLALHNFRGALVVGEQIHTLNAYKAASLGIQVDALVELGRYPEAVAVLQQMVDLRPDLESYSRVSYLRELHGDTAGAIAAMRKAVAIAAPGTEPWLWTASHLGHLYWNSGDLAEAERIYRAVLQQRADYSFAQFGLARIYAARGDQKQALLILKPLAARLPTPEFLTALGDLYAAQGDKRLAQEQYDLVHVIQTLNAAAGMNVDLELAMFDVTHGEDAVTALAAAQQAYAERPTIYAADALAWALHRTGDDSAAWEYSQEALRLGTEDALLHAHAAAIAESLGLTAEAQTHRAAVQRINPHYAPWAKS